MKENIHPEKRLVEVTLNDGSSFSTMMSLPNNETSLKLDVDPTTHPAWRAAGDDVHLTDASGQVSKFKNKFSNIS